MHGLNALWIQNMSSVEIFYCMHYITQFYLHNSSTASSSDDASNVLHTVQTSHSHTTIFSTTSAHSSKYTVLRSATMQHHSLFLHPRPSLSWATVPRCHRAEQVDRSLHSQGDPSDESPRWGIHQRPRTCQSSRLPRPGLKYNQYS